MSEEIITTVLVLDREYKIKCPQEQENELKEAAIYVDEQMQKLRQHANATSNDQIAVVTALNVCHKWMKLKKQKDQHIEVINERLIELKEKIEKAVGKKESSLV